MSDEQVTRRQVSLEAVMRVRERAHALGLALTEAAARELAAAAVTAEFPALLSAVRRELVSAFERLQPPAAPTDATVPMEAIAPERPPHVRHYELAPAIPPAETEVPDEPDLAAFVRERLGTAMPRAPMPADGEPDPERDIEAPAQRRRLFGGRRVDADDADFYPGPERRRADPRREDLDDEQRPIFRRPRNR